MTPLPPQAVEMAYRVCRKVSRLAAWRKQPVRYAEPSVTEAEIRVDLRALVAMIGAPCETCGDAGEIWDCPLWPECDCPGGSTIPECPGATRPCPDCGKRAELERQT